MRRRQAGFTLTELLVVVSIIGVLATLAIVYMRPHVRTIDMATRFGDLIREASRRAVALGPVRADVALARGNRARTEITVDAIAAGTVGCIRPVGVTEDCSRFTAWRIQEAVGSATWTSIAIDSFIVDPKVRAISWAYGAKDAAQAGATGASGVPRAFAGWDTNTPDTDYPTGPLRCFPNGTCTSRTLFFQSGVSVPDRELRARVVVMPLGGAITTRTDWN